MALNYPIDTYISLDDARDYADIMGLVLPADDGELELLLRRSAIYLDRIYGPRYLGNRSVGTQSLYWPRAVVTYYDSTGNYRSDFSTTSVPKELGQAQVELVALMYEDESFDPLAQPEPAVKKETSKLEGLESTIEYADPAGYSPSPWSRLDFILAPILRVYVKGTGRITSTRGG